MFNHHSYLSGEQIVGFRQFIAENRQNIELITSRLMLAMGFKLCLSGCIYLHEAIIYCYSLPQNTKVNFKRTVYPYLEQKLNASAHNIERNIRNAIQNCYSNGTMIAFNDICGYEMISKQYPPTISEFVINIISWMRTFSMEYDSRSM